MKAGIKLCASSFSVATPQLPFPLIQGQGHQLSPNEEDETNLEGLCFFDEAIFHVCATVIRHNSHVRAFLDREFL
jgi:hypothetical protein